MHKRQKRSDAENSSISNAYSHNIKSTVDVNNFTNDQKSSATVASHEDELIYTMPDFDVDSDDNNTSNIITDTFTLELVQRASQASAIDAPKSILKVTASLSRKKVRYFLSIFSSAFMPTFLLFFFSWKDKLKVGNLVEEHHFEIIKNERINVHRLKNEEKKQCTKSYVHNGIGTIDKQEHSPKEFILWNLIPIFLEANSFVSGSKSVERHLQAARQKTLCRTFSQSPDFPEEPEKEYYILQNQPKVIPLDGDQNVIFDDSLSTELERFEQEKDQMPKESVRLSAVGKKEEIKKMEKKNITCFYWIKNNCRFKDQCKFLHHLPDAST